MNVLSGNVLGEVYEMQDFDPPTPESLARLRAIIDEAFGRTGKATRSVVESAAVSSGSCRGGN